MIDKVKAESSLDAKAAPVDGTFFYPLYINDAIVANAQLQGTTDPAIGADGLDIARRLFVVLGTQGAGGASGEAFAAGLADGIEHRLIAAAAHFRGVSPV